ncbi:hypothetical protein [Clostridium sporogenes]|uniref:hypothetical protein n=1 Tax=Clostridium sporogenes TaxID=1509 RepID=UPI000B0AD35A|nr:hypothetical protein [Clostridium sporogenes]
MEFNYILTEKDLFNFHKKYMLTSIKFNKFLNIRVIFLIMFIFISSEFQIYVIVAFVESFLILFLLRKRWYLNCLKRKKFKNLDLYYNLKYIFTETNLKIDKKGILLETIFNKKIIKWKYINDNDVLIRSFSDYNILIPESAINSNDNLENLIQIFKENTSKYLQYSYPKNIEFIL